MCVFQKENYDFNKRSVENNGQISTNKNGIIEMDNLEFKVKLGELKDLMELKSIEAKQKILDDHGSIETFINKLHTNIQDGIPGTKEDIEKRKKLYGKNEIPAKAPKSIFYLAFEAVQDPTLIMLIICSIISIGLSFYHPSDEKIGEEYALTYAKDSSNLEWVEGTAIMIAVIVVVFVTAFNDWRKERQFRGLKDKLQQDQMASVIRSGNSNVRINVRDLVVGDMCHIKYGDLIPADGIVVQANDLKIDESALTGETDLIRKDDSNNIIVLSGTHVMEGSGRFMVTAVGLYSQTGIIMTLLGATDINEINDETITSENSIKNKKNVLNNDKISPEHENSMNNGKLKKPKKQKSKKQRSVLQNKLGKLALQIGYCGMLSAFFTFIILVARMAITEFVIDKNPWKSTYIKYIISFLIQAITVIVVAVPEGLPLAVTLALAFAVRKMTNDNNLVRHLDACETMGNATTICTDKTGTLTTNRMTAVQCWIGDTLYEKIPNKSSINSELRNYIIESISVNCNYSSWIEPCPQGGLPKQIGNKTECGLLGLVNDLGGSYEDIRTKYPNDEFIKVYTFNSERKMMSTVIKYNNGYRLHSKGASEMVLSKCAYYLDQNFQKIDLTSEVLNYLILNVIEKMAAQGLRTLCVAYRDFSNETDIDWNNEANVISDLTCICLVGIEDPVRAEVPDAIRKCQESGVVVRMITGDNIKTATSIALKCGIVKPSDDFLILESKEFNKRIRDVNGELNQDLLDKVWPRLRVLARSSPQDKYNLVSGIIQSKVSINREVVAVTGDGTNDGPALKRADIGFAMGIQGTDVAKEASDIILTDDNFSSIVKAMMWGRNVYDAIAKFLQFQLTANFAAGIFSVICAATIQAVPLKAVQMLWVNLVMDTLASLALATEPPTEDLLKRKPYGRKKSIISITMIKNIFFHTIYQLSILFCLVWYIEPWMHVDSIIKYNDINKLKESSLHFTIIFNAFVLMTLFNEINGRKIHNERNVFEGIQNNSVFTIIWLTCFFGQILIVNFGGIVFSVERLEIDHWMWCLVFGIGSLLWGQLVICIPKSSFKKFLNILLCFRNNKNNNKTIKKIYNNENEKEDENDENIDNNSPTETTDYLDKSKALWIRGAHRIHNQLQVIDAFKSNVDRANSESEATDAVSVKS